MKKIIHSLIDLSDSLDKKQLYAEANHVDKLIKKTTDFDIVINLDKLLADETVLYLQLRNFHWNIIGMQFNDLHKFFEDQYVIIEEIIDKIAERIRAIGGTAPASFLEYMKLTHLTEHTGKVLKDVEMLSMLLKNYQIINKIMLNGIKRIQSKDPVTTDLLTECSYKHEKTLWMINSLLTKFEN